MPLYYYRLASFFILGDEEPGPYAIMYNSQLLNYPSLCFALGREMSLGGSLNTDIETAYQFLKRAKDGYEIRLANGDTMYLDSYNGVLALLSDPQFDIIRDKYDDDDEDDEDD